MLTNSTNAQDFKMSLIDSEHAPDWLDSSVQIQDRRICI